ncbi:MAG: hypothetical protein NVV59_19160 [Chitinophagaceae bacterium]|nr:hypothetical protein [Chitinophagaceae bacterium]
MSVGKKKFENRWSDIDHRSSDIGHRTSIIGHRSSVIDHRSSIIDLSLMRNKQWRIQLLHQHIGHAGAEPPGDFIASVSAEHNQFIRAVTS